MSKRIVNISRLIFRRKIERGVFALVSLCLLFVLGHYLFQTFHLSEAVSTTVKSVDTSTSNLATQYNFQRKVFYDVSSGKYWSFYFNGSLVEYAYSTDGTSWTPSATVHAAANAADFSVWNKDGYVYVAIRTNTTTYGCMGNGVMAIKGTISSTSISWGSPVCVYNGISNVKANISMDDSGYVWVSLSVTMSGAIYTIRSTNVDSIAAWNAATLIQQTGSSGVSYESAILPLTSGDMYVVYTLTSSTYVYGKKYTASTTSWDASPTTIASSLTAASISATVDSTQKIHLVYLDNGVVNYKKYSSGSWDASPVALDSNSGNSSPSISVNFQNDRVTAAWVRSNTAYYKTALSPWASTDWSSATIHYSTGTNLWLTLSAFAANKYTQVLWTNGTGSPYTVYFDNIPSPSFYLDETTAATATAKPFQRKVFYSPASSKHWSFYYNGSAIEYAYSPDGNAWTISNTISSNSDDFSLYRYQEVLYIAYSDGTNFKTMRGTIGSTSITWGSETTVESSATPSNVYIMNNTTDSHLWLAYQDTSDCSGANSLFVRRSTNTDDISAWDSKTRIYPDSCGSGGAVSQATINTYNGADVMAVIQTDAAVKYKKYTSGVGWEASSTDIDASVSSGSISTSGLNNKVYLTYVDAGTVYYVEYDTSWATPVSIDATAGNSSPVITSNAYMDDLYIAYIRSNDIYYKRGMASHVSGDWDTTAKTITADGTNAYLSSSMITTQNNYGLEWTSGSGSPYTVNYYAMVVTDAATVDTSTSDASTKLSSQRKTFYDSGSSNYWSFYYNGSNVEYANSSTRYAWYSTNYVSDASADFSIYYDNSGKVYIAYSGSATSTVYVKEGTISAGTITWSDPYATDITTPGSFYPYITKDSAGYFWVGARDYSNNYIYADRSASTNSIATWDTKTTLSSTAAQDGPVIVPLGSGDVYAIYVNDSATDSVCGKLYTASTTTWDAGCTDIDAAVVSSTISAASDNDNNIHLTYSDDGKIYYKKYASATWGSAVTIDDNSGNSSPTISANASSRDLALAYIRSNIIYHKTATTPHALADWDTSPSESYIYGTNVHLSSSYNIQGNKAMLIWTTGGSSPYRVMFNTIAVPLSITISGTCKQYDQSTNCADSEVVKIAVNGVVNSKTGTTLSGSWSVGGLLISANDVVVVFVDNVADANEANAVIKINTVADVTGVELYERHLSIGSSTNQTISNANLASYDNSVSADEDIYFEVDASDNLTLPATSTSTYSDQELIIKASNVWQPKATGSCTNSIPNLEIPASATLTANGNLFTLTASSTPLVVAGTFTAGTSTVTYTGTTSTSVTGTSYYNLTINRAAVTYTAAGDMTVAGVLTIQAGTFSGSSRTINLSGESGTPFVKTGTFTQSTSTIRYTGDNPSGNTNVVAATYYNLQVDNSAETFDAAGIITASGVFTIEAGTFNAASYAHVLSGSGTPFVVNGTFSAGTSTVTYTGSTATVVAATTYNRLTLTYSGNTFTAAGSISVSSVFTISSGTIFDASDKTITLTGSSTPFVKTGTFTYSTSTFKYQGVSATNVVATNYYNLEISPPSGSPSYALPTGTINVYGNLTVGDSVNAVTVTAETSDPVLNVEGNLIIQNAANFIASSTASTTIAGSYTNNGTFTAGSGRLTFDSTDTGETLSGNMTGTSAFYNLTFNNAGGGWTFSNDAKISVVLAMTAGNINGGSANIELSGTTGTPLTIAGTFTPATSTITYSGNYASGNTNVVATTYYNVTLNNASEIYIAAGNINVGGVLNINAGAFNASTRTINLSGTTGTPFVITGTFTQTTSTIIYSGNNSGGNTNVAGATYYNLQTDNTNETYVAVGDITASNVMTITSGTFDGSTRTITLSGTTGTPFVNSGSFSGNASTFIYSGNYTSGNTNVASGSYYNLTLNNASETYLAAADFSASGVFTIQAGTFDASSRTITLSGSGKPFVINGTLAANTSTIKYTAAANTTVAAASYYNLETSPSGASSLPDSVVASPGTMSTSNASGGTNDWTSPDNAKAEDGSSTTTLSGIFGGPVCLSPDTLISTEHGDKPIHELKEGDLVQSYNFNTGKVELKRTSNINFTSIRRADNKYYHIYFDNGDVRATFDHLFYANNSWVYAEDLKIGDKLQDMFGNKRHIANIEIENNYTDFVWDLSVEDNQNFFAAGVLVHNWGIYDHRVRIINGGTVGSTDRASGTAWGSTLAYSSYGGSSDSWGETWSSSDINSSDFGLAVSAYGSGFNDGANYTSYYLKASNFGFNIPNGATINGITAVIKKKYTNIGVNPTNYYATIDHIKITVDYTVAATAIYTFAGGAINIANNYTNGDGTHEVNATAITNDPDIDINGNFINNASATFVASDSGDLNVGGNFSLNTTSVFTHSSATVTLDGSASQAVTANGTGSGHTLNNLTVTNASASGVSFADSLTVTGIFTDVTPSSKLTFDALSTYAFANININGQATGTKITMVSNDPSNADVPSRQWYFNVTQSSPSASYVDVSDSDALGGNAINTFYSTNSGNNENWLFAITISGTVYTAENKSTNIGADKTIAVSVNGAAATTTETTSGGAFTIEKTLATNNTVSIFISGETEKGSLVTQAADGTTNITGLELFTSHIVLSHNTAGPMANTFLATADNVSDSDLLVSVDGSSVATFTSGNEVWVLGGKTYTPGANVNCGSLEILSTGTFSPGASTVTLNDSGAPLAVNGTFNESTSTVVYTGSSATAVAGTTYNNLTLNQTGTTFTSAGATTVKSVFTITAGTFDASSQTITLSGTGTPFVNNGTFTASTSTIKYSGIGAVNVSATSYYNLETKPSGGGAGWSVTDAGISSYNGIYTESGTFNSKPSYTNGTEWLYWARATMMSEYFWGLNATKTDVTTPDAVPYNAYGYADLPGVWSWSDTPPAPTVVSAVNSYVISSGTLSVANNFSNGDGTNIVTLNADTNDPTIDVNGNFDNNAGATFTASSSGSFSVASNFTNSASATFTHSSGTLTLDGQGVQSITTGGDPFNNLTVSNTAAEISQADAATIAATLTINSSAIYDINGQNITLATLSNDGTFRLQGGESTVTITNKDTNSGIIEYDGAGIYTGLKYGNTYWDLKINGSGGTFAVNASATVNNSATLAVGTLGIGTSSDDYKITAATFTVSGGTLNLNTTSGVGADRIVTSGVFTISGGATTLSYKARISVNSFSQTNGTFSSPAGYTTYTSIVCANTFAISGGSFTALAGSPGYSAAKIVVNGNYSVSAGSFSMADWGILDIAGTFTLSGTGSFTAAGGYSNIYVAGNCDMSGGTLSITTPLTLDGNSANFSPNSATYSSIFVSKTAGQTLTILGNITMVGTFQVVSGGLDAGTNKLTMGAGSLRLNGQTLYDYTTIADVTIDNSGKISHELLVGSGRTLRISGAYTFSLLDNAFVTFGNSSSTLAAASSGKYILEDSAGAGLGTGGLIRATIQFRTVAEDVSIPARTYRRLEVYNATSTNHTATLGTATSQTIIIDEDVVWNNTANLYLYAEGTGNINLDASTYNPAVSIAHASYASSGNIDYLGAGSGSESITAGSGTWTVKGNIDLTGGTLTQGTSTFLLNSTGYAQTITSASQSFYNLTVANTNASGVSFADSSTVTGTFTDVTPSSKLTFDALSTYAFANININGQATGTKIAMVSNDPANVDVPSRQWYFNVSQTSPTATYVNVTDSDALGGNAITPITSTDGGNNENWLFNTAPSSPSSLAQKKVTGGATLATGDWTNENQVTFSATASDTDNPDTLYLCVEVDTIATALSSTNGGDLCGTGVAYSGTPVTVSVTITGLTDASAFHWQAQVKDTAGAYSSFVGYGGNTENPPTNPADRDFGVDTTAPTGGTVNDGTSGDQDWNDGTLNAISANWSGFDSAASGLSKYEYAVRRSSDSYYWYATGSTWQSSEAWTNNSTNTSVTVSSINLNTGENYYFSVRATDNAGSTGGVASSDGQRVNPTLLFSFTSGSTITFNDLNAGNSWTDDTKSTVLRTSTNAYGGYVVKVRTTDQLRQISNPLNFIAHYLSGNDSPSAWSGTGFGYTTNDSNLSGGAADRFTNGGPKYAGFSNTAAEPVADHTANVVGSPLTDEEFTVNYKVVGDQLDAAGMYRTTLLYTCIPQY